MNKIFFICTGLGNIQRGYESFTRECFDVLKNTDELEIFLFKGAGPSEANEKSIFNLKRHTRPNSFLCRVFKTSPYNIEQITFLIGLIPRIFIYRPDLIYYSDFDLGTYLWHFRKFTGLKFKLLFSNGLPSEPPYDRMDHVQQLTPSQLKTAIDYGEEGNKHTLLPYGIKLEDELTLITDEEKKHLLQELGLPTDRKIILSAGAINNYHKRMDYVIKEISELNNPEIFLLLLGQRDFQSSIVERMAINTLGPENFQIRTVPKNEMDNYYRASDIFVLASLYEGLGRVLLEASSFGLPCLVHDYEIPRFVLGDSGYYGDFSKEHSLKELLVKVLSETNHTHERYNRYENIYKRFRWEILKDDYIKLIQKVISS